MDVVQKVKELRLPSDQYVVIGSGLLAALGIRKANDIDIAAVPALFERLRESGEWEEEERYNKIFLKKDVFEVNPQLSWEDYPTTTEHAIDSAMVIDGIPFMNPTELIKFKTALGREKDKVDIELLKNYLIRH